MNIDLKPREQAHNRSITIEDSYWQFAKHLGQGNASNGIRKALYKAFTDGLVPDTQEPPSDGA